MGSSISSHLSCNTRAPHDATPPLFLRHTMQGQVRPLTVSKPPKTSPNLPVSASRAVPSRTRWCCSCYTTRSFARSAWGQIQTFNNSQSGRASAPSTEGPAETPRPTFCSIVFPYPQLRNPLGWLSAPIVHAHQGACSSSCRPGQPAGMENMDSSANEHPPKTAECSTRFCPTALYWPEIPSASYRDMYLLLHLGVIEPRI